MPRVKRGTKARARRNKIMKAAKGFQGGRRTLYRTAKQTVHRAWAYAYRDRRQKKRDFRRLWITRINAAARQNGMSYSKLIGGLNKASIEIDRKILAELAIFDPGGFTAIVKAAAAAMGKPTPAKKAPPVKKAAPKKAAPKKAAPKKAAPKKAAPKKASAADLHPYGKGSHAPLADPKEMPAGYPVKGNVDSMLIHRPDSRSYKVTIAEMWFDTQESAEKAGFKLAGTHPKPKE